MSIDGQPAAMEAVAEAEGGLTQDSSVEEVLEFLAEFQSSSLASPFSRADFVEGFVSNLEGKVR